MVDPVDPAYLSVVANVMLALQRKAQQQREREQEREDRAPIERDAIRSVFGDDADGALARRDRTDEIFALLDNLAQAREEVARMSAERHQSVVRDDGSRQQELTHLSPDEWYAHVHARTSILSRNLAVLGLDALDREVAKLIDLDKLKALLGRYEFSARTYMGEPIDPRLRKEKAVGDALREALANLKTLGAGIRQGGDYAEANAVLPEAMASTLRARKVWKPQAPEPDKFETLFLEEVEAAWYDSGMGESPDPDYERPESNGTGLAVFVTLAAERLIDIDRKTLREYVNFEPGQPRKAGAKTTPKAGGSPTGARKKQGPRAKATKRSG